MKISMANKLGMTVVGESDIHISYDKYVHETTALVSSDVKYSLLVAWHDLEFIDVLSQNFPVCVSTTIGDSIENFIKEELGF